MTPFVEFLCYLPISIVGFIAGCVILKLLDGMISGNNEEYHIHSYRDDDDYDDEYDDDDNY